VEIVADKAELGQVFTEYFGFLCQAFRRLLHIIIIRGWYNRPVVSSGRSDSGLGPTPSQEGKKKLSFFAFLMKFRDVPSLSLHSTASLVHWTLHVLRY
jgi:hypothetical protein